MGVTEKNYVTKAFDVMQRLLNLFQVCKDERLKCMRLSNSIDDCTDLMSKTPNSIASAIIFLVMKHKISKTQICEQCTISIPTLNKIENIIKKHLEAKGVEY
jgi:hypothetical protein